MNDQQQGNHVHLWLNAYHDGELSGRKLARVEDHLAHCPECQQARAQIEALSALLQADPLPHISTSPEQFVAQVGLRLPRQIQGNIRAGKRRSQLRWRWTVMPLGLLGAIWFLRSVTLVSSLLNLIEQLGINPQAVSWLVPRQAASTNLVLGWGVPFDVTIVIGLILPLVFAGCSLLWLALWWIDQENKEIRHTANGSSH